MEINYKKLLAKSEAPFFTRQNLELLLGTNRRTLDYRIQSLIADEVLLPLKPGFYLNRALYERSGEDEKLLRYSATALVEPSYISLEYALAFYGILAESVFALTLVTTKKTRILSNQLMSFSYRSLKPELFFGFEQKTFGNFTYAIATPEKAFFDFIYLTPLASKRAMRELLFNSRFNLARVDRQKFQAIVKQSKSVKMQKVLELL
jgi:predicted transcriptional regulator of viral defense system